MITGSLCSIGFTACRHGTYMDTNREKTRMKEKKHDEGEKHMVTLTETTEIAAPFEKLEWWVDHFEEEFVKWSPLHLECELLSGGIQAGDKVRFHEIVMGMDYDVTGTIIRAERDKDHFSFAFESDKKTAVISFEGERTDTGCRFCHTESFGVQAPVIGPVVNFLIFKILYRKKANWQLIRDDMILDNQYLTDILEKGRYPARIPPEQIRNVSPRELMKGITTC